MTDTPAKPPASSKPITQALAPVQKKATSAPRAVASKTAPPASKTLVKSAKTAVVLKQKAPTKAAKPVTPAKSAKVKKPKMVRDSMTMPKAEYAVLAELKLRAAKLVSPIKKTELLRAGIKALAAMSDAGFLVALKAVPSLKTGRPSKS